jgi:hypothetical protein
MDKAYFLHVGFRFRVEPDRVELEERLDKALSWYRYAPNCYVVYTTNSADVWYRRLRRHIREGDSMLICELNTRNHQGWMSKNFWEWLEQHDAGDYDAEKAPLRDPANRVG